MSRQLPLLSIPPVQEPGQAEDPGAQSPSTPKRARRRRAYRRHRWQEQPDLATKVNAHQVWLCEVCRLHKVRWSRVGRRSWPLYTRLEFNSKGRLIKAPMSKHASPCAQIPLAFKRREPVVDSTP